MQKEQNGALSLPSRSWIRLSIAALAETRSTLPNCGIIT